MTGNKTEGFLIGFDLGTSAVKALLTDSDGRILEQASRQVNLIRTEGGAIELDPESYYQDICSICRELVSAVPASKKILALCFSGASGNTVFLDKDYNPLGNAISWMDERAVGREAEIFPGFDTESLYDKVGWPFGGTFPLAHMGWHKRFQADLWEQAHHICMLNDYIYYRLSRRLAVDYSKATTFFLQNQKEQQWDGELLDLLGIRAKMLPELLPPGSVCGKVTQEASAVTGLDTETLVVAGSFDHPSAARATGVFAEGDVLISAGTSWVIFALSKERETGLKGNMLVDPYLSPDGCWGTMSALTAIAQKMNDYLVNCIGSDESESLLDRYNRLSADASPGADGFYLELFKQPYEKMKKQLENIETKNIARALMEGIVFLTKDRLERLNRLTGRPAGRIVLTGGPTRSPVWPNILADVIGQPVVIPETGQHSGAMGAVIMAGIGVGIYSDEKDGYARIKSTEKIIEPDLEKSRCYREIYRKYSDQFDLIDSIG